MPLAAVTRLRVRKRRFLPLFIITAFRSRSEARRTEGCLGADMRAARNRVFWTRTLWRDLAAMRQFMRGGAGHRQAMARLSHWCDEASLVDWEQESLPSWSEAEVQLRESGRLSRVQHPSPAQARGETFPSSVS